MAFLRHVIRGAGTLPNYGDHPGNMWMILMPIGAGLAAGWVGAVVMVLFFGPFWVWGCYSRSKEDS